MSGAGIDKEVIQRLTEIATGQKYVNERIDEIREDIKEQKKKQESDSNDIRFIKADLQNIKDTIPKIETRIEKTENRVGVLEDERNVNVVKTATKSMPRLIYFGIIAVIIATMFSALSTFILYQQTFVKLSDIINAQKIQTQGGANP